MIAVVALNEQGKIELTEKQLKDMLEEARTEGRNEAYAALHQPYITVTNTPTKDWWKDGGITYATDAVQTTLLNNP